MHHFIEILTGNKKNGVLQMNLVNSKSSGLDDLFRSMENSNYREGDIKNMCAPKMMIINFPHQTYVFGCVKETSH